MKYFGYKENIGYGFYDEVFEGAVPLTDTEWQNLLSQQSKNKQIVMFDGKVFATDSNLYFFNSEGKYEKYTDEACSTNANTDFTLCMAKSTDFGNVFYDRNIHKR